MTDEPSDKPSDKPTPTEAVFGNPELGLANPFSANEFGFLLAIAGLVWTFAVTRNWFGELNPNLFEGNALMLMGLVFVLYGIGAKR